MKALAGSVLAATLILGGCAGNSVVQGEEAFRMGQYDQAAAHWNEPAYAGDPNAQFYLGMLWDHGYGSTPVNAHEAGEWYSRAAKQGHLEAMVALAQLQLANGYEEQAVSWLVLAARNGHGGAVYKLREMGLPTPTQDLYEQRLAQDAALKRQQAIATEQAVDAAGVLGEAIGSSLAR